MRTFVFALFVAAAALQSTPAFAASRHTVRLAPADEYFGRQKMSILEIGNRLRDVTARAGYQGRSAGDLLHTASMAEDAMRDWQRKYPGDPWLRKDRQVLAHIYKLLRR